MESDLEIIQGQLADKSRINKKLLSDFSDLEISLHTKSQNLINIKEELNQCLNANKQLREEKVNLENGIMALKEDKKKYLMEIEELMNENLKLEEQLKQEEEEIDALEQERIKYTGLNKEMILENNTQNEQLKQMDDTVAYYQQQLRDSTDTINKMAKVIKEMEGQIAELNGEIQKQNKIYSQTQMQRFTNQNKCKDLEDGIANRDNEIKEYMIQLDNLNLQKDRLYKENTKMYNDIEYLQKHIYKLTDQNKKLGDKLRIFEETEDLIKSHFERKRQIDEVFRNNQETVEKDLDPYIFPDRKKNEGNLFNNYSNSIEQGRNNQMSGEEEMYEDEGKIPESA